MSATPTLILTMVFKAVVSYCGPRTPAHEAGAPPLIRGLLLGR